MKTSINKILVIRFSSLGDIILTQPIISQLREIYPHARIDYLTKPQFVDLVSNYFPVDNVYSGYKSWSDLRKLHTNKYSLVIDLHNKFNSCWAKLIISAKTNITYCKRRSLRQKIVAHKTNKTINSTVDLYNSVFDKLGLNYDFLSPSLGPLLKSDLLPEKNKLNIAIFPGATHNTKRIPLNKLISFINDYPHPHTNFYLFGSKSEQELTQKIKKETDKTAYDMAGLFSLVDLVKALNETDLLISNDSGPMHIGAALGKPQIAFFGSTHTDLGFRPLNPLARVITFPVDCSPCSLHGQDKCPRNHFACMQNISVNTIYNCYQELIADKE